MTIKPTFDEEAQRDLLAGAARLYDAEMHDQCMVVLSILMGVGNRESYVLAGHCVSEYNFPHATTVANGYYEAACELGSAVGCFNLYLNHEKSNAVLADLYLQKARDLGWNE